jgi:phosphoribosyl 1,2-cyclic phosphodiesterase
MKDISAVLITHEHADHIKGLRVVQKASGAKIYASRGTLLGIPFADELMEAQTFCPGEVFLIGSISVQSFATSHDAAEPCGFSFTAGSRQITIVTDTGCVTDGCFKNVLGADILVLESNHDPVLLKMSDRPVSLKQRISGRCGHLSNGDAADLVREVRPPRLKTLLLAHLSQQCNAPYLAREAMESAVADLGRNVTLDVLEQDSPSALYEF